MENKYYTPDIEDIRVGYECEIFNPANTDPFILGHYYDSWDKITIHRVNMYDVGRKEFRTPYLTKEQIEAEGWIHIGGKLSSYGSQIFEKISNMTFDTPPSHVSLTSHTHGTHHPDPGPAFPCRVAVDYCLYQQVFGHREPDPQAHFRSRKRAATAFAAPDPQPAQAADADPLDAGIWCGQHPALRDYHVLCV